MIRNAWMEELEMLRRHIVEIDNILYDARGGIAWKLLKAYQLRQEQKKEVEGLGK